MSRITRVTAIPFGSTGTTDDFETFGSTADGSTVYSKDIAAIQAAPDWLTGWRAALIASKAPVLQDMNAKMLVDSNLICYLFQEGTPEYNAGTTYYIGSVVKNLANSGYVEYYASLINTNTGNALPTRTSDSNWAFLYAINTTALGLIIPGTRTNDSAAAGNVGEYISAAAAAATPASSLQYGDVASIALTKGDWDISCLAVTQGATVDLLLAGVGTATGNVATGLVIGDTAAEIAATAGTSTNLTVSIPAVRKSITSTTTFYLKEFLEYASGSPTISGRISARRVR